MSKFRSFSFTWNNYDDDSEKYLRSLATKYVVFGKEVAPSTGTPHLQGMVTWPQPRSLSACIKSLPGCHVEPARVEVALAKYVTKEGEVTEWGERPAVQEKKGDLEKTRWKRAREAATSGNIEDIEDELYVRYYSTFKKMKADHPPPVELLDGEPDNEWHYGDPGSGKTRGVWIQYPGLYPKSLDQWWEGYRGEEIVLLDDVDKYHRSLGSHIKLWAQQYPFIAAIKGSSAKIRPKKIIITSNYCPGDIWGDDPMVTQSITRRFKLVYHESPSPK